ncbi:hypothetical protein E1B28_004383 [Marasmius oreades]|uniref:RNA polymerase II assembly factor Rtp1 C-terminal domain-containing protein n=1 Tax=Marasmius oreades TaxID=181124 RepID=A0A9P8AD06_9AGAR|nr:uncharacterized protein E1B28_004383 [Marasmius oreades]KAG7096988.1 hypothetical protein E1B28_004383 [Marasmius oreades]
MIRTELTSTLLAGSCLLDSTSTPQNNLKGALIERLTTYYATLGVSSSISDTCTLEEAQLRTAIESLCIVERIQGIISVNNGSTSTEEPPLLGVRDLAQIRTLLSISFHWGVEPLLSRIVSAWPERPNVATSNVTQIIDLTTMPEDYHRLSDLTSRILRLVFPAGPQQKSSNSLITEALLNRHLKDIFEPAIALGWLPKSLASDSMPPLEDARPFVMRLLGTLPVSQTIAALGGVISTRSSVQHVRRACGYLLSRQLLRPDGIRGLCAAIFGESEGDDIKLEQLEHVSRTLSMVPANINPQDYFSAIIPRLVDLLHDAKSIAFRRASSFTISRLLTNIETSSPAPQIILSTLHFPFLHVSSPGMAGGSPSFPDVAYALSSLSILLANSDPSPKLISTLLSPIIAPLYAVMHHLDSSRTSDPSTREIVHDTIMTWFRVSAAEEAVATLMFILDDQDGKLELGFDGKIKRAERISDPLSLFTPESLRQAEETGQLESGANWLDLYPDPVRFVGFIQSINRQDIISNFFVLVLEAYRDNEKQNNDPIQTLRYLQVIIQMQTFLSNDSKLGGFQDPVQILKFIEQVLEDSQRHPNQTSQKKEDFPSRLAQLSLEEDRDTMEEGEDSDDDMVDSEKRDIGTEMTETALIILLSVLEGNKALSTRTTPILSNILLLLEHLITGDSPNGIKELAREVRLVLTARLAMQNAPNFKDDEDSHQRDVQKVYQQALKLLQDPILPLRAHGLLLLRQLVSPSRSEQFKAVDPALIPAIQDVFMQSVQDNDSYIFLNAVQGLAALVDHGGAPVLKRMLDTYTCGIDGLEGSSMSQQDLDTRLRLGEATGIVVSRCGTTLGTHGNYIVPSLLRVLRSSNVPTALKMSALSLLADCQKTYPLVLLPFFGDLSGGTLDLIQLETRSTEFATTIEDEPTSKNSKFPGLRRAALHFMSLLLKGTIENIYDTSFRRSIYSEDLIRRTKLILSYISDTDADVVVRVMAREALELSKQLEYAIIDPFAVG